MQLHKTNIIHRDLACRNLLVDEKMDVFVADFGFARLKRMAESKGFTLTGLGPVRWEAPESLQHKGECLHCWLRRAYILYEFTFS